MFIFCLRCPLCIVCLLVMCACPLHHTLLPRARPLHYTSFIQTCLSSASRPFVQGLPLCLVHALCTFCPPSGVLPCLLHHMCLYEPPCTILNSVRFVPCMIQIIRQLPLSQYLCCASLGQVRHIHETAPLLASSRHDTKVHRAVEFRLHLHAKTFGRHLLKVCSCIGFC